MYLSMHHVKNIKVDSIERLKGSGSFVSKITIEGDDGVELEIKLFSDNKKNLELTNRRVK